MVNHHVVRLHVAVHDAHAMAVVQSLRGATRRSVQCAQGEGVAVGEAHAPSAAHKGSSECRSRSACCTVAAHNSDEIHISSQPVQVQVQEQSEAAFTLREVNNAWALVRTLKSVLFTYSNTSDGVRD